jgi:hypothetical protein
MLVYEIADTFRDNVHRDSRSMLKVTASLLLRFRMLSASKCIVVSIVSGFVFGEYDVGKKEIAGRCAAQE